MGVLPKVHPVNTTILKKEKKIKASKALLSYSKIRKTEEHSLVANYFSLTIDCSLIMITGPKTEIKVDIQLEVFVHFLW